MIAAAALAVITAALCPSCGGIPADPDRNLERAVESGQLRVGASPAEGLVVVDDAGPSGRWPDAIEGYADSLGVEAVWTIDGEEALVAGLERGDLDVVVGRSPSRRPGPSAWP